MTTSKWWRTVSVDNDGKPIVVYHSEGLQISQDTIGERGAEMVYGIYVDGPKGEMGKYLGEAPTLAGAKRLAKTLGIG